MSGGGTESEGVSEVDFDEWYAVERTRLVAVLMHTGHAHDEAEEVADEAMARALARWQRVSQMSSPAGWATVVAFNLARRRGGRAGRERGLLATSNGARPDPDPADRTDPDLWEAVHALPRRQRTMVVLRYVHDLPEAEIARLMKIRRGTVASGLHDARHSLARSLAPPELPPAPRPDQLPRVDTPPRLDAAMIKQIKEGP